MGLNTEATDALVDGMAGLHANGSQDTEGDPLAGAFAVYMRR